MKIGVVIPCINLWQKYTQPALESIKSKHELYFVLVDNGSDDITKVEATKRISDNFHYKRNDMNWGVAKSWNYGALDCFMNHGCDYVFIINNDVVFHPEALDRLVDDFNKQPPEIVMMTAINVKEDCGGNPTVLSQLDIKKYEVLERPESPDFSAFMINKRFWEEVGEFDEGFGQAYFEDNDAHRRIRLAGLNALKCPSALYYHYGSRTRMEARASEMIVSHESFKHSREYFVAKWGGPPEPDGRLGARLWEHPFNDENNNWAYTKQLAESQADLSTPVS